jgi:hypothetical protein
MEEKWNEKYCYEVFNKDGWTICLRPRCNKHPGEPDMKVWVLLHGEEVAQYTNEYRGYGQFKDKEDLLPNAVRKSAKKAWKKLCEGRYTEENLRHCRNRYFERHGLTDKVTPKEAIA